MKILVCLREDQCLQKSKKRGRKEGKERKKMRWKMWPIHWKREYINSLSDKQN